MPAIFAYEQGVGKPARVGRITRIRSRQNIIRISFEFDQDIQPLTPEQLVDHAWDFDLNRYEMNRTHWAIKDIDLFAALDEIGIVRRVEAPRPQDTLFSRRTVIAAASQLQYLGHTNFGLMLLELGVAGLDASRDCGGLLARSNALANFAVNNDSTRTAENETIGYAIVRRAVEVLESNFSNFDGSEGAAFLAALESDGFTVSNQQVLPVGDKATPQSISSDESSIPALARPVGESSSEVQEVGPNLINPSIFHMPDDGIQENLVAVMMPFAPEFDPVIEAIRTACCEASLECMRVDDMWEDSTIIQDIFSLICRSRIVVVDLTGRNSNVFYETGIAHTLGKVVVPITQSEADVPFDLQHHRVARYRFDENGLQDLVTKLVSRLRFLTPNQR
ncbi:MAG: hypothetical protein HOC88_03260 [Rhodospirillaceae bacterium]|jgi:hypothetical protein|nr:hypothetical protein [Rhodospirillaceae bacterium]